MFALCLLIEKKLMTYRDPMVTYSHPKMTYSYAKVTHSDPTHLPLPPPASPEPDLAIS